jgi:isopenicillin N synthase-like dioxygenase
VETRVHRDGTVEPSFNESSCRCPTSVGEAAVCQCGAAYDEFVRGLFRMYYEVGECILRCIAQYLEIPEDYFLALTDIPRSGKVLMCPVLLESR